MTAATIERRGVDAGEAIRTLVDRFDPAVLDETVDPSRVRLVVREGGAYDVLLDRHAAWIAETTDEPADAVLAATADTWRIAADDDATALDALRTRGFSLRRNLHLATAFLAATGGGPREGRLRLRTVETSAGTLSASTAGTGPPLLALHGLGGTKASFLPTLAAMSDAYTVTALDLPGFGDSAKPLRARYDAHYFAGVVAEALDALGQPRAHVAGNSMGGRIGLQLALDAPERVDRLVLLSPAMAWLRPRRFAPVARMIRPELRLVPFAPGKVVERVTRRAVPGGGDGWAAAGVDEFLRAYRTPRGRFAFHASARNIYLDEPHGETGLWTRLERLEQPALFVWGRQDKLVPVKFMRHVERTLPQARHLELECGHVPQVELPVETHEAMREHLAA